MERVAPEVWRPVIRSVLPGACARATVNAELASEPRSTRSRKMARLEGLEPPTYGLEIRCSIRLSYRRDDPDSRPNTCC